MGEYECISYLMKMLQACKKKIKNRKHFSGIGIIVYDDFTSLPISPLKNDSDMAKAGLPMSGFDNIVSKLSKYSDYSSRFHDGFALISKQGVLTHVCQFFSPPIKKRLFLEYVGGGRHRAAVFGSCEPSVVACGILSNTYGPIIFAKGTSYNPVALENRKGSWNNLYSNATVLYDSLCKATDCKDAVWDHIRKNIENDKKTVEIGAGTGKYSLKLSEEVSWLTCIESNKSMFNYLNTILDIRNIKNVDLKFGDFFAFPLKDNCAFYSFWALSNPWNEDYSRYKMLFSKLRKLKHSKFVLTTSAPGVIGSTVGREFINAERLCEHKRKKERFIGLLMEFGFRAKMLDTEFQFKSCKEAQEIFPVFFGKEYTEYIKKKRLRVLPSKTVVLEYAH